MRNRIFKLRREGLHLRSDCDALACAIVVVEEHFRPFEFRVAEYLVFSLRCLFRFEAAMTMTLGMNQLRADLWAGYLGLEKSRLNVLRIAVAGENFNESVKATRWFLRRTGWESTDEKPISATYTGRRNHYYDRLVKEALD